MTNTAAKWFYQMNQIVKGPISISELKKIIQTFPDPQKTLVWSRGYTEWIAADRWNPNLEIPEATVVIASPPIHEQNTVVPAKYSPPQKTDSSENLNRTEKFRVQLNFIDQPSMTKDELMAFAARVEDPAQIAIFDAQSKDWKEIYAYKDIVEKLGLSRRKHQRVPILAQFTGESTHHNKFTARLVTISIGGLGLTEVFDLKIGDKIWGQVTSPHFYSPVTIEADVTYSGNDGYVGLKFTQINDDSQSLVTDYVKRFSQSEVK